MGFYRVLPTSCRRRRSGSVRVRLHTSANLTVNFEELRVDFDDGFDVARSLGAQARRRVERRLFVTEVPSIRIRDIFARGAWPRDTVIVREGRFASNGARVEFSLAVPSRYLVNVLIAVTMPTGRVHHDSTVLDIFWEEGAKGERPRFHCQARGCRCDIVYLLDVKLLCRKCAGLVYPSQWKSTTERKRDRAAAIRAELGGSPEVGAPFPPRQKGRHLRRYLLLMAEAQQLERDALADEIAHAFEDARRSADEVEELLLYASADRERRRGEGLDALTMVDRVRFARHVIAARAKEPADSWEVISAREGASMALCQELFVQEREREDLESDPTGMRVVEHTLALLNAGIETLAVIIRDAPTSGERIKAGLELIRLLKDRLRLLRVMGRLKIPETPPPGAEREAVNRMIARMIQVFEIHADTISRETWDGLFKIVDEEFEDDASTSV